MNTVSILPDATQDDALAACRPGQSPFGVHRVAISVPVSFDLVVWALDNGATPADVRAAHELCREGEHAEGEVDRRIGAFYMDLTARYPDRKPVADSPWAYAPLHVAIDHVTMCLTHSCADAVLEMIEGLAGRYDLMLLDLQDGTVYPPPTRVR
jgi:hypothetical protein